MKMVRTRASIAAIVLALPATSFAKDTQFWNLTTDTITSLQISPPGKNDWGDNQTENDSDKSVSPDERLKITGVKSGTYDVKFVDRPGHVCVVRDVEIKEGKVFTFDKKTAKTCDK
jgi:hypothetical protein